MCPETAVRETAWPTLRPRRLLTRREGPDGVVTRCRAGARMAPCAPRPPRRWRAEVHPSTASRLMRHRPSAAPASPRILAVRSAGDGRTQPLLPWRTPYRVTEQTRGRLQRAHQGIPLD